LIVILSSDSDDIGLLAVSTEVFDKVLLSLSGLGSSI
jgi:hypothetical protein